MADLSSMSDAELEAIASGSSDISKMSDAELEAIANGSGPKYATMTGEPAPGIGSRRTSGFLGMFSIPNIVEGIYNAAKSAPRVTKDVMTGKLDPVSEQGIQQITPLAGLAVLPSAGRAVARPNPAVVNPENVAAAASQGYRAAEAAGATAPRGAMQGGLSAIGRDIAEDIHPALTPTTTKMLEGEAARYVPPKPDYTAPLTGVKPATPEPVAVVRELQKFREQLNGAIQDSSIGNKDRMAAITARNRVDLLMQELAPEQAAELAAAGKNYGGVMRHDALQNLKERALDQAGAAASGRNIENALRQQVRAFIKPDDRGKSHASRSGFTEHEIGVMRKYTREGVAGSNLIRFLGNLLGGGGGLGAGAAGYAFGPAAPIAGYALKTLGNSRTATGLDALAQQTLQRAPAAAQPLRIRVGLPRPNLPPVTLGYPTFMDQ